MVAEAFRWRAHYMKIKEILSSGTLGAIHFAKLSAKWYFSPTWSDPAAMRQPHLREQERLLIQEMGPHWFDTYLHLFGEPRSVTCRYRRVSPFAKGEDLALVIFEHDWMMGLLEGNWVTRECLDGGFNRPEGINTMDYVAIDGATATLRLDCNGVMEVIRGRDQIERVTFEPGEYVDAHKRLHQHFIECLDAGRPFAASAEHNLRVIELVEQAYASAREGKP
jgi:predicted dehydrogenase